MCLELYPYWLVFDTPFISVLSVFYVITYKIRTLLIVLHVVLNAPYCLFILFLNCVIGKSLNTWAICVSDSSILNWFLWTPLLVVDFAAFLVDFNSAALTSFYFAHLAFNLTTWTLHLDFSKQCYFLHFLCSLC